MHRLRRRDDGFTLLETLVALFVFSIGALGVLGMVLSTIKLNMNSRQITEASQLGIRQMERLQIMPKADTEWQDCGMTTRCYLHYTSGALAHSVNTEVAVQPSSILDRTAGSNLFYEVVWRVNDTSPAYLEVIVYWPKDRNLAGIDWSGEGLDCPNTNNCYSVQFLSHR